ncbi:MAG TPA: PIN domain-containing protein [Burkholderiaceae bacterium]|nr:PIN domain-containing protein [Burkholderiaceae bacterium]
MIVDSSAWIAHLRLSRTSAGLRLARALREREPMLLPDAVLIEVLRGATDYAHFLRLERALLSLPRFVPADERALARASALLYARCRWAGITPRAENDCLIACCAIETGLPLLHEDRDFEQITRIEPRLRFVALG